MPSAQSSGWSGALNPSPIWIPCRRQNHQTEHLASLAGATDRQAHCAFSVRVGTQKGPLWTKNPQGSVLISPQANLKFPVSPVAGSQECVFLSVRQRTPHPSQPSTTGDCELGVM